MWFSSFWEGGDTEIIRISLEFNMCNFINEVADFFSVFCDDRSFKKREATQLDCLTNSRSNDQLIFCYGFVRIEVLVDESRKDVSCTMGAGEAISTGE